MPTIWCYGYEGKIGNSTDASGQEKDYQKKMNYPENDDITELLLDKTWKSNYMQLIRCRRLWKLKYENNMLI